ncbi:MAG: FecR domain-containing protein [Chloroflexi bacterium]|nr:FecR domain-containing protein [Chloroflexota bacterium]
MKSFWRLTLILAVVLAALGASSVLAQDTPPQPVYGAINIIVPELYSTPSDGVETRLIERSIMESGETLRTDEEGVALLTWFYEGSESVLGQNSSLTLNELSGTAETAFVLDLTLNAGHLVSGLGYVAAANEDNSFVVNTPAYAVKLLRGQFELTVAEDGTTSLVVTEGRVEVTVGDAEAVAVDEGQYLVGAAGEAQTLSTDGATPNLTGACTATVPTNLVVRFAPNQDSRSLGGVLTGQVLWVRAATEGNLWLQVYFQTAEDDEEGHNYGWVYGPAVDLNPDTCGTILRAPLDSMLFGGAGVDEAGTVESDPIS